MKTYTISSLESGKVMAKVEADGFTVDENGLVVFYQDTTVKNKFGTNGRRNVGITQISPSTVIDEVKIPGPALVVPFPSAEGQCTSQS